MTIPKQSSFFVILVILFSGGDCAASNVKNRTATESIAVRRGGISPSDWQGIVAAYQRRRHAAAVTEGGYQFHNSGQQWSTELDGRGFLTKPDQGNWSWGLELKSYGRSEDVRTVASHAAASADGQTVSYHWDSNLTEWYKNDGRGLEHGYTVDHRVSGGSGVLTFNLNIRGDLSPRIQNDGRDVLFVHSSGAPILNYAGLSVLDADGKSLPARFESTYNDLTLSVVDRAARYPITIDPVAQLLYLKASNTATDDQFGYAVAVSGNTVAVGAVSEDSNSPGINGDQSSNAAGSSGAVYIFTRTAGVWTQQAYIKASNPGSGDEFGGAVALSGDTLVVGARFEDSNATGVNGNQANNSTSNAGAAYVFVRNGATWTQQAYLKASNTGSNDFFGFSVAVSGDTVAVSAVFEDSNSTGINGSQTSNSAQDSGAVYVFTRNGTTWTQQAYVKASNTGIVDYFGNSVALSGDTMIVGAPNESSISQGINGNQADNNGTSNGAAYVFVRSGTTWTQEAYIKESNNGNHHVGDQFGQCVSISGNTAIVSAPYEDFDGSGNFVNGGYDSGAVYVFERSGSTWIETNILKASTVDAFDQFGYSSAISGDIIVVGANGESSSAAGVNGDESDNSVMNSGAAYVFQRNGGGWNQIAYLKASNSDAQDQFGIVVAVSGDILIVSTPWESSNATGINGNQADNSAASAGAAYLFDLDVKQGTSVYGTGTPGCAGTQTLGATHAPMINSPHFAFTCNHAPPFSLGLGLVTDSQDLAGSDPFGIGVLIHCDFIFATEVISLDFYSDGTGYSETADIVIPNNSALVGKTYYACALWGWTSCTLPGFNLYNLSSSRGLAVTILNP